MPFGSPECPSPMLIELENTRAYRPIFDYLTDALDALEKGLSALHINHEDRVVGDDEAVLAAREEQEFRDVIGLMKTKVQMTERV
jgi:hypothetical protein